MTGTMQGSKQGGPQTSDALKRGEQEQQQGGLWGAQLLDPTPERAQFNSVAQSCLTLCDLMDCSTPGFPVHHQVPGLTQTYVHRVGDAIQPSHPLSSPSPAFSLSHHQGLFQ